MKVAEERGYAPITSGYSKHEHDMLDNTIRDMQGCQYLLVECTDGTSVYRKKTELDKIKEAAA